MDHKKVTTIEGSARSQKSSDASALMEGADVARGAHECKSTTET